MCTKLKQEVFTSNDKCVFLDAKLDLLIMEVSFVVD